MLKALSDVWTSGQVDQACVDGIRKHLSETSADPSLIAGIDRFELNRSPAIISKSFTTNHQKYSDTSTLDPGRTWDTNLSARRDVCDKAVSLPSIEDKADFSSLHIKGKPVLQASGALFLGDLGDLFSTILVVSTILHTLTQLRT
jgi:hypothetical protein